jgi:flagellar biogenesis protein FliO
MDSGMLEIGFKMSVALGVVLLTFGAAVMIAKRFTGAGGKSGNGKQPATMLEVLSHKAIGQGRSLFLVKCREKIILIGATNAAINAISEFDAEGEEMDDDFSTSLRDKMESEESGLRKQLGKALKGISRI